MTAHQHDLDEPCPACYEQWEQAGSISRLRELTARFIEGRLRGRPKYFAPTVDPETAELVSPLAAINRGGLLTDGSQPGLVAGDWVQRAWVSGYATEAVVDALLAGCLPTDLLVLTLPPGMDEGPRVCITRQGRAENTWAGAFDPPLEAYPASSPKLLRELTGLWRVDVIDPVWGRNDLLWPTVQSAVTARPARRFAH